MRQVCCDLDQPQQCQLQHRRPNRRSYELANTTKLRQSGHFDGATETGALLHFWSLALPGHLTYDGAKLIGEQSTFGADILAMAR
jgi:hypothetical protein